MVFLEKLEPEFIEVREYLAFKDNKFIVRTCQADINSPSNLKDDPEFHSWIDDDWRKIYLP